MSRLAMRLVAVFFAVAVIHLALEARSGRADCARVCESEGSSSFIYVPASLDTGRPEECVCRGSRERRNR